MKARPHSGTEHLYGRSPETSKIAVRDSMDEIFVRDSNKKIVVIDSMKKCGKADKQ